MPIKQTITVKILILFSLVRTKYGSSNKTKAGAVYCKKMALAAVVSLVDVTKAISNGA